MSIAAQSVRVPARSWRRFAVAFGLALAVALLLRDQFTTGFRPLFRSTAIVALVAVLVFTVFERWPRRMPRWTARWALQVIAVGVAMPITTLAIYILTTNDGAPPFWEDRNRMNGWMMLTFFSILVAPWTALAALLRQREAFARESERQALDARLRLLQAQVAPHFLFNTLANIQSLVDAGSPRASEVLRSLTAYLRAAVPLLDEPAATLGRELQLVRAYLELMHMRIPDRLRYELRVDDGALALRCPPTSLLTLVENAVRHGIDPSEEGGAIDIEVQRRDGRCLIRVSDTGVGLRPNASSLGTGLATLRERLLLMYGGDAQLRISARPEGGVCAELEIPT